MRRTRPMRLTTGALAALLALVVVACGDDDGDGAEAPVAQDPPVDAGAPEPDEFVPADTAPKELPDAVTMVPIPGGTFTMGGPSREGDAPEVTVTVSDFTMSTTEITNAVYVEFLNAADDAGWIVVEEVPTVDPCTTQVEEVVVGTDAAPHPGEELLQLGTTGGCTSDGHAEHLDNKSWIDFDGSSFVLLDDAKADWPVNWVRWYGADAFARFYGVSLPSEAQWEYAARGGAQLEYPTADGTLSAEQANYNGDTPGVHDATGHSVDVGSYDPNPFGLHDLGGNVWEWCADYYAADAYEDGAVDPRHDTPGPDEARVRRGGSWNYHSATLLTYARASDLPGRGNNHFGFRVVG